MQDHSQILTSFQVRRDKNLNNENDIVETKICCSIHEDQKPFWVCTVCKNLFCKVCPVSDGGKLRSCLFCGGACVLYSGSVWRNNNDETKYNDSDLKIESQKKVRQKTSLDLMDFMAAVTYPFYYPFSFVIGVILFISLIFGQIITIFDGGSTLLWTLAFVLVVIMLKFGVFLKTIDNFMEADFQKSFIPRFTGTALFEDFIRPLLVGIGVYISSFGLFAVLTTTLAVSAFLTIPVNSVQTESGIGNNAIVLSPSGDSTAFEKAFENIIDREEEKISRQIRQSRFEKIFGHNHLLESESFENFVNSLKNFSPAFYVPIFLTFIFGILYFPAACVLSSKKGSINSLFNYKAGFKEIKLLKSDYVKIQIMIFGFIVILLATGFGINWFSVFLEIPSAGILVILFAESVLILYFWLVFSGILGILLCTKKLKSKNSNGDETPL